MGLLRALFRGMTRGVAGSLGVGLLAFPLSLHAQVFNVPPDAPPATLGAGQVLNLGPGGTLPGAYNALAGSTIYVAGGAFADNGGSRGTVIVSSGSLGPFFDAEAGARIYMAGGDMGFGYDAFATSQTTVAGGAIAHGLNVLAGAEMIIYGYGFAIGGTPVPGLDDPWDEITVTTFNGARLTGTLHNGANFGIDLNAVAAPMFNARFHPGAILRLVRSLPGDFDRSGVVDTDDYELWRDTFGQLAAVPGTQGDGNFDGKINGLDFTLWRNAMPPLLAGDYNRDGSVNQFDYLLWKASYGANTAPGQGADGNGDGVINAADYVVWRNQLPGGGLLTAASTTVPEPAGLTLLVVAALVLGVARGRTRCDARRGCRAKS